MFVFIFAFLADILTRPTGKSHKKKAKKYQIIKEFSRQNRPITMYAWLCPKLNWNVPSLI